MKKRLGYQRILIVALLLIAGVVALRACFSDQMHVGLVQKKLGDPVDSMNGVLVYYNGSVSNVSGRNLAPDGYNVGLKYQCVEFVKRYYYEHYHHKMPDSYGHAKSFYDRSLEGESLNKMRGLTQYANGGKIKPAVGDLIVFDGTIWNEFGHVAIISAVEADQIQIIQQNPGPSAASRIYIDIDISEGNYTVGRSDCLGWLRMP